MAMAMAMAMATATAIGIVKELCCDCIDTDVRI